MNSYTEYLEAAVEEYLRTDKSQFQIAKEYGLPRSTLNDHIRMRYGYVDKDMARRALGLSSLKVAQEKSAALSGASDAKGSETASAEISGSKEDKRQNNLVVGVFAFLSGFLLGKLLSARDPQLQLEQLSISKQLAATVSGASGIDWPAYADLYRRLFGRDPITLEELESCEAMIQEYNKIFGLS